MLYRLTAGDVRFKHVTFRSGLNILTATRGLGALAQPKSPAIDRQRSRNGAGKTSLVHILHFVLGGQPDGPLASEALGDWSFSLELDVGSAKLVATRSLSTKNEVWLSGQIQKLNLPNEATVSLNITKWNQLLGSIWFGLDHDNSPPTFRALFPYFARWDSTGGFLDATRYVKAQRQGTVDTNLSYLFGFDYQLVRRLFKAKEARDKLKKARTALRDIENEKGGSKPSC